jgi:iron complex transport system substrate-binding protein
MHFVLRQFLKLKVTCLVVWAACCLPLISIAQNNAAPKPQGAFSLTDDRGRLVVIEKAPLRIISLLPSLGEIVCELQACDRLVGVDRYSNWPELVQTLPKLGGIDDTQLEALVKLKPDLVLLARSARVTQRLESMGIKVVALEPQNQEDMRRVIQLIAGALHLPQHPERAHLLWQKIQNKLDAASLRVPAKAKGMRIYFEAGSGYFAAGEASYIGETLKRLGLVNVVPSSMGAFPQVNPEFIVKANPQIIFMGERTATDLKSRPGWQRIDAISQQKICAFTPEQSDIIVRSGPRIPDAADLMVACLKRIFPE